MKGTSLVASSLVALVRAAAVTVQQVRSRAKACACAHDTTNAGGLLLSLLARTTQAFRSWRIGWLATPRSEDSDVETRS